MKIHAVETMDQVLQVALERPLVGTPAESPIPATPDFQPTVPEQDRITQ